MRSAGVRVFACLFAAALTGCGSAGQQPDEVKVGGPAPHFSLRAIDGTTVSSDSLKGEVVILSFWSTTCPTCVGEIPTLNALASRPGVQVVGVALDRGGEGVVKPFVQGGRRRVDYPVVLGNEEVFRRFDGFNIPYTLVLDPARRVARIYRGPVSQETLEVDVQALKRSS
jgi:thiol-disulfide isomerase/thioredoxin